MFTHGKPTKFSSKSTSNLLDSESPPLKETALHLLSKKDAKPISKSSITRSTFT